MSQQDNADTLEQSIALTANPYARAQLLCKQAIGLLDQSVGSTPSSSQVIDGFKRSSEKLGSIAIGPVPNTPFTRFGISMPELSILHHSPAIAAVLTAFGTNYGANDLPEIGGGSERTTHAYVDDTLLTTVFQSADTNSATRVQSDHHDTPRLFLPTRIKGVLLEIDGVGINRISSGLTFGIVVRN